MRDDKFWRRQTGDRRGLLHSPQTRRSGVLCGQERDETRRRTDGRYHWIKVNGQVEQGPDGTPLRLPGVRLDVEEEREAEEKLAQRQEMLRLATDIGEIGEWYVDQTTGTMFWPPRVIAKNQS